MTQAPVYKAVGALNPHSRHMHRTENIRNTCTYIWIQSGILGIIAKWNTSTENMVNTVFMIVDKFSKRTPRTGVAWYAGTVVTKEEPTVMKAVHISEPSGLGEQMANMEEDQCALLTNVVISTNNLRSTQKTEASKNNAQIIATNYYKYEETVLIAKL